MSTDNEHPRGDGPGLVAGRYRTVRAVGRGGMGTVWLATDERLGRQVALKQLAAFPGETEGQTQRAMREARHAAALNHPNVVAVYDVVEHDDAPWLVMEYVDGPTLSEAVRERGPLRPRGAADLGAQLAAALASAHAAGVVHRDIKPANVLIGDRRPKLADFGTARAGGDDQITRTGLVTGTPTYMAPEVADGREPSQTSDLWALGATLYFAVEGRDAFESQGNPLATLRHIATNEADPPQNAGPLAPVIRRLMDKDPARRGDAATARADLERVRAGGQATRAMAAAAGAGAGAGAQTSAGAPAAPAGPAAHDGPAPASAAGGGGSSLRREPGSVDDRRDRRGWLPWLLAGLALLFAAAVAAAVLSGRDGSDGGGSGSSVTQSPTTSEPTTSSEPSTETKTETMTETSSPQETSSTSTSETPEPPRFPQDEVADFVRSHFAALGDDPESAWSNLTPAMREAAGGQEDYEELWSRFDSVEASDITVDEETGRVTFTLTRTLGDEDDDGESQPTSDQRSITVVRDGEDWKIDSAG